MTSRVSSLLSRVVIKVIDRNPRLPEVPNHRILMRFEPEYEVRADPRTHMLQTLKRKWEFLTTLDEYLRPECRRDDRYICANDIDLLLINIASGGLSFMAIFCIRQSFRCLGSHSFLTIY